MAESTCDRFPDHVGAGMEPLVHRHYYNFSSFLVEPQHRVKELNVLELLSHYDDYLLAS
jgi:hypothetical protein